mgnify:FL=1
MRDYIRRVSDEDVDAVTRIVASWDYPRVIETEEVRYSSWYVLALESSECRLGPVLGVAWFHRIPQAGDAQWWAVHAIGDPAVRRGGTMGTPRIMHAVELIAEMEGARRLYGLVPLQARGSGLPVDLMRRYLTARGWSEDDLGAYITLGAKSGG